MMEIKTEQPVIKIDGSGVTLSIENWEKLDSLGKEISKETNISVIFSNFTIVENPGIYEGSTVEKINSKDERFIAYQYNSATYGTK